MGALDLTREHDDSITEGVDPLVLDRQRVVHSSAFRRLQFKTQVFVATEGDHYRTRLTHTLEVAHLARRIAAELDANGDLAEVVALAHDLGHAPFGHAGERALDECMQDHGGFEHNAHSLRVVEYLEHPYPPFRGLNLTHAVRECLAKHTTRFDTPGPHALQDGRPPPIEGQIAAVADRLTYGLHDLQDGLYAGLVAPAALASVTLWRDSSDGSWDAHSGVAWRGMLRPVVDRIQDALVADVVAETRLRATRTGAEGADAGAIGGEPMMCLSDAMESRYEELEEFVAAQVYRHPKVVRMDGEAGRGVRAVFEVFVADSGALPVRYAARVGEQGVYRVAADYVAGMTDRFCREEGRRLAARGGAITPSDSGA